MILILSCGVNKDLPEEWKEYRHKSLSLKAPKGFVVNKINEDHILLRKGKDTISIFIDNIPHYPIPLEMVFTQEFYAVHYNKFFDRVLLDPKVKKLFRDSVTIREVVVLEGPSDSISCSNCNVVAKLEFKKSIFDFPAQMSDKALYDDRCHIFKSENNDQYEKLIFLSKGKCGTNGILLSSSTYRYLITSNKSFPFEEKFYKDAAIK